MQGKHVLLGISGSIASYKAAFLIRLLIKKHAIVRVIMTHDATKFITPLSLSTLSKNEVLISFEKNEGGIWNNHVELGLWADIFLIVPATASTLAKMANGISDNLLIATYLSAKCPVFFGPSMDLDMWKHPSTQENIKNLLEYGNHQIGPDSGELASGLTGEGRMTEPEEIMNILEDFFQNSPVFSHKKILITAGPTRESLDPIRYLTNHSTGKMGYALAECLAGLGAQITLISGPSSCNINHPNVKIKLINSAEDMFKEVMKHFPESEITILTAAVADYRPKFEGKEKIKSDSETFNLEMVKNRDIAKHLGEAKRENQVLVGFALETENEIPNAIKKLKSKNLDFIVLNSTRDPESTFGFDTNKITIIDKDESITEFALKSKKEVARDIVIHLQNLLQN